ncbi:MAG: TIGR01777 family oxidoreductase, partial [Candidatus Eiseniibacteriota bacterium]
LPGADRRPACVHERSREKGLIVISGGRGLVGRALMAECLRRGDAVRVLTRGAPRSAFERHWNPAAPAGEALAGAGAIVHLAGATIARRWSDTRRREIRDSRVGSTRALVAALGPLARRPRVLVSASAIGIYGDRGDQWLTESSAVGEGFLATLAKDWEDEAARAETLGVRVVMLRFGIVLDRGGGVLARLIPLFRFGLGGAPGSGRQWWSWIAIADAVRLVLYSMEQADWRGAVNAVSPAPVTALEFAHALGRVLSRPALAPAPAPMLRLVFGAMADEVLLSSQRVEPARLNSGGFEFAHPELEGALGAACKS